jgi:hypothetical protein
MSFWGSLAERHETERPRNDKPERPQSEWTFLSKEAIRGSC